MRTNRIFWALLLVGVGFLFLASNLGFISVNVWGLIWPIFLILLGIFFIIGTSRGPVEMVQEEGSVDLAGAASATVRIKHGAGVINMDNRADPGKLASGTFTNGLDAKVNKTGDHLDVVMQPERWIFPDLMLPWNWIANRGYQWDFGLTKEVPLNLVFETGAGEAKIDLTELQVKEVKFSTGASSTEIKLPASAGITHVRVEAGAASVVMYVPDGVAARIESESGLASISIDQSRFPKMNGYYQSSNYEEAENKTDIRLSSGVASIEIH
jgi:hypothetical protein